MKNKDKQTWILTPVILMASLMLLVGVASGQNADDDGFENAGRDPGTPAPKPVPSKTEPAGEQTEEKPNGEQESGEQTPPRKSPFSSNILYVMIGAFVLLYIFMGRGRRTRQAKRKEMLATMKKGDKVITIGGIVGTIVEARDDEIVVKVSDNTRMTFSRWAIRNAGEEVKNEKKQDEQQQQ